MDATACSHALAQPSERGLTTERRSFCAPDGHARVGHSWRVTAQLPTFRYHPDPVATGEVVPSTAECSVCHVARGFVYVGPVYAIEEVEGVCPWCIADGAAAAEFDAEFTDVGWGVPSDVPPAVTEEIAKRTPGFRGSQQEHWLYHCRDAAAFLGRVGFDDLAHAPEALEMLKHENDEYGWTASQSDE